MSYLDEATIAAIDARIQRSQQVTRALGTVAQRDTVGSGALVVLDGATTAQPVKVLGHVHCLEDDRVALELFGSAWVVVGTFARRQLSEAFNRLNGPALGASTSSGTYSDQPAGTSTQFLKRYDLTAIRVATVTGCYATIAGTSVNTGVHIEGTPGSDTAATFTPIDLTTGQLLFNTANEHQQVPGFTRTAAVPSGDYLITVRWRRAGGTGAVTQDGSDFSMVEIDEIFRTSTV